MSGVPHPPPGDQARSIDHARSGDPLRTADQTRGDGRDLWPRDFGRDGVSGLVTLDRAQRARDVSRPRAADEVAAESVVDDLLARIEGRPRAEGRPRSSRGAPHPPVPHPPVQRPES